ncbi:hypothetical protein [Streptomyces sp. GS7]|uniref:hypothetical protein n=1 Tax=Streptomyces sp. GS7 TaxID=2692234 RepID=UPI00131988E5|nr:hypothetical protein [Streptomyces sp. GS7]QHC21737.1 hypothetical protein GR130_10190 [Streptomyces sp. GS7]
MEAELVALATAGATTLVQQMATEGWATVRRRMAAFLARRRGTDDDAALEEQLEAASTDVAIARQDGDEAVVTGVTAVWQARLRRLLSEDPEAAAELRALLDEVAPRWEGVTLRDVHNTISGGEMHGPVIQAGVILGTSGNRPPSG